MVLFHWTPLNTMKPWKSPWFWGPSPARPHGCNNRLIRSPIERLAKTHEGLGPQRCGDIFILCTFVRMNIYIYIYILHHIIYYIYIHYKYIQIYRYTWLHVCIQVGILSFPSTFFISGETLGKSGALGWVEPAERWAASVPRRWFTESFDLGSRSGSLAQTSPKMNPFPYQAHP